MGVKDVLELAACSVQLDRWLSSCGERYYVMCGVGQRGWEDSFRLYMSDAGQMSLLSHGSICKHLKIEKCSSDMSGIGFPGCLLSLTFGSCLLYTSPSPRDLSTSRMPSSA